MHLPTIWHVKRAGMCMNKSSKEAASLMSLWVIVSSKSIKDAQRLLNMMPMHDVIAWSAMILGHVKCGQGHKVLELF